MRYCRTIFANVCYLSGADKTFGLRDKDGKFYNGNKEAKIKENNIIVGNKEYASIPGLWELIVPRSPDDKMFTNGYYDNYAEIMHSTNALRRNNDESETKPKAKQKLEMETHIKTNLGRKGSVYRKRFNTFNSHHHFTM